MRTKSTSVHEQSQALHHEQFIRSITRLMCQMKTCDGRRRWLQGPKTGNIRSISDRLNFPVEEMSNTNDYRLGTFHWDTTVSGKREGRGAMACSFFPHASWPPTTMLAFTIGQVLTHTTSRRLGHHCSGLSRGSDVHQTVSIPTHPGPNEYR